MKRFQVNLGWTLFKFLLLSLLSTQTFAYVLILERVAVAISPPLSVDSCYRRIDGEYIEESCPEGVEPLSGRCVAIITSARGTVYNDIDCQNANVAGQINPAIDIPDQTDGGAVPENEEDSILNACDRSDGDCERQKCENEQLSADNCGIVYYLVVGINFLSALAGISIIGSVMIAGFQYMTAKDNSGQVEAARKRITWAFVAFALFLFMYSALNFLIPGGLL